MKKLMYLFSVCFLFSVTYAFGQKETPKLPIDNSTRKITYTEVVFVDSLTNKQELFSRAKEWFAKTFQSSTNVIQMEDKEDGKIIGKALLPIYNKTLGDFGHIHYTISIFLKDGRYKYELSDFYHKGQILSNGDRAVDIGSCESMINTNDKNLFGGSMQKTYNNYLNQMDIHAKELIFSLKSFMAKKLTKTENDW